MRRALVLAAVLVPALLWGLEAHACPVCFSGTEENREAFFWTFVLLTTLPLATIGAFVFWLARRAAARSAT